MLAPKDSIQVSAECHFPCPRELLTEDREKILCNRWVRQMGKGKMYAFASAWPLIYRVIKAGVNKTTTPPTHHYHVL